MSRIKVNSIKPLLRTKLFTVNELDVEFGNHHDVFHGVTIKPGVYVLALTPENEIILTKQYRHLQNKEYIELVSGHIEEGEQPVDAARRELEEEAGIKASQWKQIGDIEAASTTINWSYYYFLARDITQSTQNLDPSEDLRIIKMPLEEAVEKILEGEIVKQSTITGILLLFTMFKRGIV